MKARFPVFTVLAGLASFTLASCAMAPPVEYVGEELPAYTGNGTAIVTPQQRQAAQAAAQLYRRRAPQRDWVEPVPVRSTGQWSDPATDVWSDPVREAASRFAIPERWIREVMRQESGGRQRGPDGTLITSWAGAMGLMQVMPGTYDVLRRRYALGNDPYNPRDNIMAGAAYIREMYDRYGAPGFLAAYNAGPLRVDAFLARGDALPAETRNYVARIAPRLGADLAGPFAGFAVASDDGPVAGNVRYGSASGDLRPASMAVASTAPVFIAPVYSAAASFAPAGRPQPMPVPRPAYAAAQGADAAMDVVPPAQPGPHRPRPAVLQAMATGPVSASGRVPQAGPAADAAPPAIVASYSVPHPARTAYADVVPVAVADTVGAWAIELGTYADADQSRAALHALRGKIPARYADGQMVVTTMHQGDATMYRAELVGLTSDTAVAACAAMLRGGQNCVTVPPGT